MNSVLNKQFRLYNPTKAFSSILLPQYSIDIKIPPLEESRLLHSAILQHIDHYVKAFKLEVRFQEPDVVKVTGTTDAPKSVVEALVETPAVDESAQEPAKVEQSEVQDKPPVEDTPAPTQEKKVYTEEELYSKYKNELVELATSLNINADGTKAEIVARILAAQSQE